MWSGLCRAKQEVGLALMLVRQCPIGIETSWTAYTVCIGPLCTDQKCLQEATKMSTDLHYALPDLLYHMLAWVHKLPLAHSVASHLSRYEFFFLGLS